MASAARRSSCGRPGPLRGEWRTIPPVSVIHTSPDTSRSTASTPVEEKYVASK